jgi:hypothetical protein
MKRRNPLSLVTCLALAAFAVACGDTIEVPYYTLQINSADVVQPAVDQIEIVIRPSVAGQRFEPQIDMTHFGGNVSSRVTGAGEFAIFVEKAYIDENARPGDTTFVVDVPLMPVVETADPGVEDPTVDVTFIQGTDRIATTTRFLPWPLPEGGEAVATVQCNRPPRTAVDFSRQCTNNRTPLPPPTDGGAPPPGDGGM